MTSVISAKVWTETSEDLWLRFNQAKALYLKMSEIWSQRRTILVYFHHGNILTFLPMVQFSDIFVVVESFASKMNFYNFVWALTWVRIESYLTTEKSEQVQVNKRLSSRTENPRLTTRYRVIQNIGKTWHKFRFHPRYNH